MEAALRRWALKQPAVIVFLAFVLVPVLIGLYLGRWLASRG